jgi:hypothetical protein
VCASRRLYFDARGELDLRLPMSSSIAVVRLRHNEAAAPAAPASDDAAAAGGHLPTAATAPYDLDAWATRLLVHAPDACQTFVQKPGHFKVRGGAGRRARVDMQPSSRCNTPWRKRA